MADKYVKLADVKRKLKYIFKAYGVGGFVKEKVEKALNNLPYSVKGDLETALEVSDVQPVDRWISVEERLPENNRPVLCCVSNTTGEGRGYVIGSCEHSEFWFLKIGDDKRFSFPYMRIKTTHWMPLPEPPKEEQLYG